MQPILKRELVEMLPNHNPSTFPDIRLQPGCLFPPVASRHAASVADDDQTILASTAVIYNC